MPMIPERERQQIREIFERDLVSDVRIDVFSKKPSMLFIPGREETRSGPSTEALVSELAELTDHLQVQVHDIQAEPEAAAQAGVSLVPALVLHGSNAGNVRFLGAPSGYEFSTLVSDIVDISTGQVQLADETIEALDSIAEPVHIQVFSTPT